MRIVVFGASGATGQRIIDKANAHGHSDHNINKVFVVSLHAAGDSLTRTSGLYRFLCTRTQIRHATHDSNVMESLLAASKLDWLAARPVTLTNGNGSGSWKVRDNRIGSFATISRADVAAFLVAELDKCDRSRRTPSLSS
jgi:putative NADH-flavin reductase